MKWLKLFFLIIAVSANAQRPDNITFRQFTLEKSGVGEISAMTWDSNGNMWLATLNGLSRYNGYSVKTYHRENNPDAILSDSIKAVFFDSRGKAWLTYYTTNNLTVFEPETEEFRTIKADDSGGEFFPDAQVSRIYEDHQHRIWVCTWGRGLVKMDLDGHVIRVYQRTDNNYDNNKVPNNNRIKGFVELSDNLFLIAHFEEGDQKALPEYFDASTETFSAFPVQDYLSSVTPVEAERIEHSLRITNFIYRDKQKNFWFGTYSALIFFDVAQNTVKRVSGKPFSSDILNLENARGFVLDENENLWVNTTNAGILMVNLKNGKSEYLNHRSRELGSLADNRIVSMNKDRYGNIWVCTENHVINVYLPYTQQFHLNAWEDMDLDFTDRSVQVIPVNQMLVMENGQVLISNGNGLYVYDVQLQKVIKKYNPENQMNVSDPKGQNSKVESFKLVGDQVYMISPNDPAELNLITGKFKRIYNGGRKNNLLFRHNNYHEHIYYVVFPDRKIRVLNHTTNTLEDFVDLPADYAVTEAYQAVLPDGKWFVSLSNAGFSVFDPSTREFEIYNHFSNEHYFPDSSILSYHIDREGMMWIGTGNGIYRFNSKSGEVVLMNKHIGIENEPVNALIKDKNGIFWIALKKELVRWDVARDAYFRYDSDFGLYPGMFIPSVAQADHKGRIYIVSINGLIDFDPLKLIPPSERPTLFVENMLVNEKLLSDDRTRQFLSGNASLSWNENFIELQVYTNQIYSPKPAEYFYRLNENDEWIENGSSNKIKLSGLNYGTYKLELKAKNAYGLSSNIIQISFVIARPFWFSPWFYLMIAALVIVIVFFYIRYREQKHLKLQKVLEEKVEERTAEVTQQAEEIKIQHEIIQEKNKELTDSILYAYRIQSAMLPSKKLVEEMLPGSFILYKPKDIVAGDFYWITSSVNNNQEPLLMFAACDCTGHGVPGAMVSVICHGALNRAVREFELTDPGEILNKVREFVLDEFDNSDEEVRDGMDVSLCVLHAASQKLYWSGANNPLWIIRNGELIEFKPDKQPIGKYAEMKPFTTHEIQLFPDDLLYVFSDGFQDQFGGPNGKKFKAAQLRELLLSVQDKNPEQQKELLNTSFERWRGNLEQVDDVCVIGVRI